MDRSRRGSAVAAQEHETNGRKTAVERKSRAKGGTNGLLTPKRGARAKRKQQAPPKVFISWSGPVAKTVGESLSKIIPAILDVEVFFSPETKIGKEWRDQLRDNLKKCDPSLIILTPETAIHWVIWEASALDHSRDDSHIIPVLLGIAEKDAPDPLATRQAISFMPRSSGEDELAFQGRLLGNVNKLVKDLNEALGAAAKSEKALATKLRLAQSELMKEIRDAVERIDRQKNSTIASVERNRKLLVRQLDTLCDTMDSPAYFMNKDYDITGANIAANAMFGLSLSGGTAVAIDEFIGERQERFVNFQAMLQNFETHFRDAPPPPYFREEAVYDHAEFGRVTMNKVGILVGGDDPSSSGWVVTWNLIEVERRAAYLTRIEQLVTARRSVGFALG